MLAPADAAEAAEATVKVMTMVEVTAAARVEVTAAARVEVTAAARAEVTAEARAEVTTEARVEVTAVERVERTAAARAEGEMLSGVGAKVKVAKEMEISCLQHHRMMARPWSILQAESCWAFLQPAQ